MGPMHIFVHLMGRVHIQSLVAWLTIYKNLIGFPVSNDGGCGSTPGVMMADTLSFNAKIGVVNF